MSIRLGLAALASFALAGCVSTPPPLAEGPARLGQVVYAGGPRVRPVSLVEDSRCPMNARCVWAGRATVRAEVILGSGTRTLDLTLGEPVLVADGQLTLVSVTPERMAGDPKPDPTDYRFAFEFAGGL